jgi:hypothetical protein
VQTCDTRDDFFCQAIPGNNQFVCQYSYKPDGALCPASAAHTGGAHPAKNKTKAAKAKGHHGTHAALFSEEEEEEVLVGLSAREVKALGLPAHPSVELMDSEEPELELAQLMSTVQTASADNSRNAYAATSRKGVTACGRCRDRVCVSAQAKFCKAQRLKGDPHADYSASSKY